RSLGRMAGQSAIGPGRRAEAGAGVTRTLREHGGRVGAERGFAALGSAAVNDASWREPAWRRGAAARGPPRRAAPRGAVGPRPRRATAPAHGRRAARQRLPPPPRR